MSNTGSRTAAQRARGELSPVIGRERRMQPNLATAGAVRVGQKAYAERASGPVIVHLIGRRQGHDRATKVAVMTTTPGRRAHSTRRPARWRGGADDPRVHAVTAVLAAPGEPVIVRL